MAIQKDWPCKKSLRHLAATAYYALSLSKWHESFQGFMIHWYIRFPSFIVKFHLASFIFEITQAGNNWKISETFVVKKEKNTHLHEICLKAPKLTLCCGKRVLQLQSYTTYQENHSLSVLNISNRLQACFWEKLTWWDPEHAFDLAKRANCHWVDA